MHPAVDAAERAVRNACRALGIDQTDARAITRVEVTVSTYDELRDLFRSEWMQIVGAKPGEIKPLTIHGIAFYPVQYRRYPAWTVIAPAAHSSRRLACVKVEGPTSD
jgi:hypothetical protein